jgi:hypothetical protein
MARGSQLAKDVEVRRDWARFDETGKKSASSPSPAMHSSWTKGVSATLYERCIGSHLKVSQLLCMSEEERWNVA